MATWYYEIHGAQRGPVSEDELRSLYARGEIRGDTLVWHDGMTDWQPLGQALPMSGPPPMGGAGVPPPSYGAGAGFYTRKVENHLVKAILVTIFCCLPLGIVSIVFAAQVNGKADAGNYAEAERLSKQANTWANWAIGVGIAWMVLYVLFVVVLGAGGAFGGY